MKIIRDGKEYALSYDELLEARNEFQRNMYVNKIDDYICDGATCWSYLTEKIPDEKCEEYVGLINDMADECMVHEYYDDYCSDTFIQDLVDEELGEFLADIGLKFEEE